MTDNITHQFEGVVTDVCVTSCKSKAGRPFTRVTFSAASTDGTAMKFNTFGNIISEATGDRDLAAGDKVKLTYEVKQASWNGRQLEFNNIVELEVMPAGQHACTDAIKCQLIQLKPEIDMLISKLAAFSAMLATFVGSADDNGSNDKKDELPF